MVIFYLNRQCIYNAKYSSYIDCNSKKLILFTKMRLFIVTLFFLLLNIQLNAQINGELPLSVPEAEGVSSQGIINFLDAAEKSKTEFHSFMMLRHGKIIAQGWWNPYGADLKHTMYSCSKSFTATAIGFAVSENRLTVNDKVISFFPNDLPDTVSSFLSELTVKDVLSMSDGQEPDPTFTVASRDSNWVKSFWLCLLNISQVQNFYTIHWALICCRLLYKK